MEEDRLEREQEEFFLHRPSVGATQVNHIILNESSGKKLYYVAPVHLAQLQQKKTSSKSAKKLVPLIEPDICNYMKMDFLPDSILPPLGVAMSGSYTGGMGGVISLPSPPQ